MRASCIRSRAVMRTSIPDGTELPASIRRHVDACLPCAAFEARERRLARAMRGLATRMEPVPAHLEGAVMAAVSEPEVPRRRPIGDRIWKPAAVAAAVAVGVVVASRKLDAPV